MSEPFDEQISEFIDDEMSSDECEFFVRRLTRDEAARGRYLRYQLIGAAVRGEHIQHNALELQRRLDAALTQDAAQSPAPGRVDTRKLVVGAGIAASVVLLAVLGFGTGALHGPGSGDEIPGAELQMTDVPQSQALDSFAGMPAEVTGIQYVLHHAGYTSMVNRTFMQSSLVASRDNESGRSEALAIE